MCPRRHGQSPRHSRIRGSTEPWSLKKSPAGERYSWGLKEFTYELDDNGWYPKDASETAVFNNGETAANLGFGLEWVATFPASGEPKLHLLRAADCWACEAAYEVIAVAVPSKKIEKFPFPGKVKGVNLENEALNYDYARDVARMGTCGPYLAVGSSESRKEAADPWALKEAWGLRLTSTGETETVRAKADEPAAKEILGLLSSPPAGCTEIPGRDTHQYL